MIVIGGYMRRMYFVFVDGIHWDVEISGDTYEWVPESITVGCEGCPDLFDVLNEEVRERIMEAVQRDINEGEGMLV